MSSTTQQGSSSSPGNSGGGPIVQRQSPGNGISSGGGEGTIHKNQPTKRGYSTTTISTSTGGSGGSGGSGSSGQQQQQQPSSSSSSSITFLIGPSGKRELRRTLIRSKEPVGTIRTFQQTHSLHTTLSKAFQTIPHYQVQEQVQEQQTTTTTTTTTTKVVETLDSDSVLTFLSHLGVRQYDVHKRISDMILKQLEMEIRSCIVPMNKTNKKTLSLSGGIENSDMNHTTSENKNIQALLELLKKCWLYTTTLPELRPILLTLLKQLGSYTPIPVLIALAERDITTITVDSSSKKKNNNKKDETTTTTPSLSLSLLHPTKLKHADIYRPLPSSLKRLIWEADWDHQLIVYNKNNTTPTGTGIQVPLVTALDPKLVVDPDGGEEQHYKKYVHSTLLYETIGPYMEQYINDTNLQKNANHMYGTTMISERKVRTTQRRALVKIQHHTTHIHTHTQPPQSNLNSTKGIGGGGVATTTTTGTIASIISQKGAGTTTTGVGDTNTSGGGTTVPPSTTSTTVPTTNNTGLAISQLRHFLCDTVNAASTYRPKLLYAVITTLIAQHGGANIYNNNNNTTSQQQHPQQQTTTTYVTGAHYLHCTLVSDILLSSAGGPLPKAYSDVLSLARILDECVQDGMIVDKQLSLIQTHIRNIFQPTVPTTTEDPTTTATTTSTTKKTVPGAGGVTGVTGAGITTNVATTGGVTKTTDFVLTDEDLEVLNEQFILNHGIEEMKLYDPQHLFLNPVTDDIAPGYSKIISEPMCVVNMEQKVYEKKYHTILEWERDVSIMYQNCITYNQGGTGQWFRGEANRQKKIYQTKIIPKVRKQYQRFIDKIQRRNTLLQQQQNNKNNNKNPIKKEEFSWNDYRKRPLDGTSGGGGGTGNTGSKGIGGGGSISSNNNNNDSSNVTITPLQPSVKKRKKEKDTPATTTATAGSSVIDSTTNANTNTTFLPSMPCLASMLLSDPFVVRILIQQILSELRNKIIEGCSLPYAHGTIPSLLQLLYMVQYSSYICQQWGKKFIIPSSGMEVELNETELIGTADDLMIRTIAFASLRRVLPIVVRLLYEVEFDQRISNGGGGANKNNSTNRIVGDLYEAVQVAPIQLPPIKMHNVWQYAKMSSSSSSSSSGYDRNIEIPIAILKGALIHACCQNKTSTSSSSISTTLGITFTKFVQVLCCCSSKYCDVYYHYIMNDTIFFTNLVQSIIRHKTKITREIRDEIIQGWYLFLHPITYSSNRNRSDDDSTTDTDEENSNVDYSYHVNGTILSAAHEGLIRLLNDWSSFGNTILPRDKLMHYTYQMIHLMQDENDMIYRLRRKQQKQAENKRQNSSTTSSSSNNRRLFTFTQLWSMVEDLDQIKVSDENNNNNMNDNDNDTIITTTQQQQEERMKVATITSFRSIKIQYERMLRNMPLVNAQQWKEKMGIMILKKVDTKKEEEDLDTGITTTTITTTDHTNMEIEDS